MAKICNRIFELRKENNLTQTQLADLIGTTADSIYSWEKGRAEPSVDFIVRLVECFGVSAGYLLGIED